MNKDGRWRTNRNIVSLQGSCNWKQQFKLVSNFFSPSPGWHPASPQPPPLSRCIKQRFGGVVENPTSGCSLQRTETESGGSKSTWAGAIHAKNKRGNVS